MNQISLFLAELRRLQLLSTLKLLPPKAVVTTHCLWILACRALTMASLSAWPGPPTAFSTARHHYFSTLIQTPMSLIENLSSQKTEALIRAAQFCFTLKKPDFLPSTTRPTQT